MRKMIPLLLTMYLMAPVWARIAPINMEDLIQRSDFIAVVDVTDVKEPTEHEQIAGFESIRILKGSLRNGHKLYRGHRPICARPSYKPGRYLLFLREEDDRLVAAYHAYSIIEVKDNTLDWFEEKSSPRRVPSSLQRAEADIKELVK